MATPQPDATSTSVHAVHQCQSIVPTKYTKTNSHFFSELRHGDNQDWLQMEDTGRVTYMERS